MTITQNLASCLRHIADKYEDEMTINDLQILEEAARLLESMPHD